MHTPDADDRLIGDRQFGRVQDDRPCLGTAESAEVARTLLPDLVLMDVRMPGMGGVAAAKLIKERRPPTLIVLTSTGRRDELPLDGTDMFVDAFVRKGDLGPGLLDQLWTRHVDPT